MTAWSDLLSPKHTVSSFLMCLVNLHKIFQAVFVCSPLLAEWSPEHVVMEVPEGWKCFLDGFLKWPTEWKSEWKQIWVIDGFCKKKQRSYSACQPLLLFLSPAEMLESNNLVTFEGLANSSSYHTFLLDEEKGRLVVGAKDHIFSFNLLNIRDYSQVRTNFWVFHRYVWIFFPSPTWVFLTDFKCAPPSTAPVRSSGISGPSVLFPHKSASCIFQTSGSLHTITCCVRTVRCSLYTWMNNGVNWNKVDNKSHRDLFNPRVHAHADRSCADSHPNTDSRPGLFPINRYCFVFIADPLAGISHQKRRVQVGREGSVGKSWDHSSYQSGGASISPPLLSQIWLKNVTSFFLQISAFENKNKKKNLYSLGLK